MRMRLCTALCLCLLASCDPEKPTAPEPRTPQEMYDRAQALLKPNVEHDASDTEGAMRWLRRAAEAGHLQAQTDLAGIYLGGGRDGKVKHDYAEAFKWFSAAAEQGSAEAHLYLGMLCFDGSGTPQDEAAALAHWRIAAEANIADAQFRLGRVLARRAETAEEGIALLRQASREGQRGGIPQAATALGNIYIRGNHVPADPQAGAKWYAIAASLGDPLAQYVYAEMLLNGDPVPQDVAHGMKMLRLAAGQDYAPAMASLINILRNAPDAPEHEQEAEAWNKRLEQLMDRGHGAPRP